MWSDYEADYHFAMDKAIERSEEQDRLRSFVPVDVHAYLVEIGNARQGGPEYWCKHGYARAYFGDGTFAKLNDAWDWSRW